MEIIKNELQKSGFLLIDKDAGMSSFGVISRLRRIAKIKKIGHAGTLDPFATGLLIVAVGRGATKEISRFVKMDKVYEADIMLGAVSTTHDPEGEIVKNENAKEINIEEIKKVLDKFIGEQEQTPPMHSAKKINGQRLYDLARKGKEVERKSCKVSIYSIELLDYNWPQLRIRVAVSSGTYIRVLGADIGEALGTGAYLNSLRRISIGDFSVGDAKRLGELGEGWESLLI